MARSNLLYNALDRIAASRFDVNEFYRDSLENISNVAGFASLAFMAVGLMLALLRK